VVSLLDFLERSPALFRRDPPGFPPDSPLRTIPDLGFGHSPEPVLEPIFPYLFDAKSPWIFNAASRPEAEAFTTVPGPPTQSPVA